VRAIADGSGHVVARVVAHEDERAKTPESAPDEQQSRALDRLEERDALVRGQPATIEQGLPAGAAPGGDGSLAAVLASTALICADLVAL
jgi:hypothetical protein